MSRPDLTPQTGSPVAVPARASRGPLCVAIVGCGKMASAHAAALLEDERCELVAAVDPVGEAAAGFARRFSLPRTYADHRAMLRAEAPDIVVVCTWPPDHAAPVVDALAAGVRGILCEKPLAVTLSEADRMVAAAEQAGAIFMVGHQRRLEPRYALARQLVAQGAVGEVLEVIGAAGGDLLSDGTHLVDLVRFLLGDPPALWVFAGIDRTLPERMSPEGFGTRDFNTTRHRYGHRIEGGAVGHVQFARAAGPEAAGAGARVGAAPGAGAGGARLLFETGCLARPTGYQSLRVEGTLGRLAISGDPSGDGAPWLRIQRDRGWEDVPLPRVNAVQRQDAALLDSVLAGRATPEAALLLGHSARADLEILLAALESAVQRERVPLPLQPADHPLERLESGEGGR